MNTQIRGLTPFPRKNKTLQGAGALTEMKSVAELGKEKGNVPLPENESVSPENVIKLRKGLKPGQVREWQEAVGKRAELGG